MQKYSHCPQLPHDSMEHLHSILRHPLNQSAKVIYECLNYSRILKYRKKYFRGEKKGETMKKAKCAPCVCNAENIYINLSEIKQILVFKDNFPFLANQFHSLISHFCVKRYFSFPRQPRVSSSHKLKEIITFRHKSMLQNIAKW